MRTWPGGSSAAATSSTSVWASRKDDSICEYSSRGPDRQVTLVAPAGAINYIGVQGLWTTDRSGKYGINQADHDRGFLPGERDPGQSELEPVGDAAGHYSG